MKGNHRFHRMGAWACTAALVLSLLPASSLAAGTPAVSKNIHKNDYTTWSAPVTSYLYENEAGGLTRVEYTGGQVVIENYSNGFSFQSSQTISPELPLWGGFYAGKTYNFLIFGQKNPSESNSTEVIRVVKYDKDWNRLGAASLKGANTTVPFDAGSLRCDEYGGYLYIRTCHEMYTNKDDGLNHQSNLTMAVRQSDLSITDSFSDVMNISYGYVSHSFNQYILVDQDGKIIALDHGDAYPRSAVLVGYYSNASTGKFSGAQYSNWCWNMDLLTFAGNTGNNTTGGSVGGLAETSDGYVMTYNYDGTGGRGDRTIYFQYMDKPTGKGRQYKLNGSAGSTTPMLAPTGLDGGYVLWNGKSGSTVDNTLHYIPYAADGTPSEPQTASAPLSDCQPIPYEDGVVWYVTDNSVPTFYVLDDSGITSYPVGGSSQPETTPTPTPTPSATPTPTPSATPTPTPSTADDLYSGNSTVTVGAAVLKDGTLVGWGPSLENWNQGITTLGTGFVAVTNSGPCDYYALKADGTLWAWSYGKFATYTGTLTQIASNVKQISGNLFLKNDGSVWSNLEVDGMSQQQDGELYKVMDNVKQVNAGAVNLAVTTDGTLYSWYNWNLEDNMLGRVPQGAHPNMPGKVMEHVAYVSNGLILRTDGSLWSWGDEDFGQLGNGEAGPSQYGLPTKIMDNVTQIWGGGMDFTGTNFAMTADGTLYSWGYNGWDALGYEGGNQEYVLNPTVWGEHAGPIFYQDVPRPVDISDVVQVVPSGTTTLFLKSDGSLWGVGNNSAQELNLGEGISGTRTLIQLMDGVALPGQNGQNTTPQPEPTPEPEPEPEPTPDPTPVSFSDVPSNAWYAQYAKEAAQAGLMKGTGGTSFSPNATLSTAEVVTLAARLHADRNGNTVPQSSGAWYQGAYEYCLTNGLFTRTEVPQSSLTKTATRYQMVDLLDRAVPDSEKQAIKTISDGYIPDLRQSDPYGSVVYQWYRAGIVEGDGAHRFNGSTNISRAETAAILCRLAGLTPRV